MKFLSRSLTAVVTLSGVIGLVACSDESTSGNADNSGGTGADGSGATGSGGDASGGTGGEAAGGSGGDGSGGLAGSAGEGSGGAVGGMGGMAGAPAALEDEVEIYSWWTAGSEKSALDAVVDSFESANPGTTVINRAEVAAVNARTELENRLESGDPPDSFQLQAGAEFREFASFTAPLEHLESELTENFPDEVLATVKEGGKIHAVPLHVSRLNNLYYNSSVLAGHSVAPPETLAEFYTACEAVDDVTTLAIPPASWSVAAVVFDNLMPTVNGGEFHQKFVSGQADLGEASDDRAELEKLFGEFSKVVACSNLATAGSSSWIEAADLVIDGDAAMMVMGDWTKTYFDQEDFTDYGVNPGLGSEGYFVFGAAVFPLANLAPHPNAARAFLGQMASAEGQLAFSEAWDSVPSRLGVSLDGLSDVTRASAEDYAAAAAASHQLLLSYNSAASYAFQMPVNDALLVFALGGAEADKWVNVPVGDMGVVAGDVEYIVGVIEENYSKLD